MACYTLFPAETTNGRQNTVSTDGLEELLTYDDVLRATNGVSTAVLTAAGYKPGMWSDVAADSWDDLHALTDTLTGIGVNCALADNASYNNDPDMDWNLWTKLLGTRYPVNAEPMDIPDAIDRPSYDLDELEYLFDPENEVFDDVERRKGEFLGYPASGTEAYLSARTATTDTGRLLHGVDAVNTFEEDYDMSHAEKEHLIALSNYVIENSPEAFEDLRQDADARYRALEAIEEAYGVPVTQVATSSELEKPVIQYKI